MIRIAVVDDKKEICSHIEKYVSSFSAKQNIEIEVEPYFKSEEFIFAIKQNREVFDLIFLDIELDEKTGIDIANMIRYEMRDELQPIVYISGKSSYSLSLHDTHPLDFIVKPVEYDRFEKVMIRYLKITGKWTDVFSFQSGVDYVKIKINKIKYFSVVNKDILIHTVDGQYYFKGSLREIEQQLRKYDFLYIHRSYLVNPLYVKIFEYDKVILSDNKTKLPIGSSRRAGICKKRIELQHREKGD